MAEQKNQDGAAATARQIAELTGRIDAMAAALERMESRLDVLHQECQRTASAAQRMLLRQESLSNAVGRIEDALQRQ